MPAGLQLYTVSNEAAADLEGTLRRVAALGFAEVELAGLHGRKPRELRRLIADAGLRCRSAHLIFLADPAVEQHIEAALELGIEYLVAPVPWKRDISGIVPDPDEDSTYAFAIAVVNSLTLDDWKWNADLLNRTGETIRKAGLQFLYHNHNFEFRDLGEATGYEELLRLTNPELVGFELDPGWIQVSGHDPVALFRRHAPRIRLIHVRDFAPGFQQFTSLTLRRAPRPAVPGSGVVNFEELIHEARASGVDGFFVEREPAPGNLDAVAADCGWLNRTLL
jgi:sugar phosphate isomerase/epimerase